ncbi:M20 family metallo-hydrolase [Variovorax sp. UC74_104]|uniref:M20 family metallo-hydrolase n=1 Tax=Variovorax sp. UC74_104 TaxID=3374555 RepID=UPI0037565D8C
MNLLDEVGDATVAHEVAHAVDAARLEARLRGLAAHGAVGTGTSGGVARQALSAHELAARRWLVQPFAQRPGYRIGIDAAANVFVRRDGQESKLSPVVTGSHIDTQPLGGWLDGAFGVAAGLEVFDALDRLGLQTRRPIEVAMWTNEEGSRFAPGLMGSVAFTAPQCLDAFLGVRDGEGLCFEAARDAAVDDLRGEAQRQGWAWMDDTPLARPVHCFVEAHIEQGPVLEAEGLQVGCVTAIQGVRWFRITVPGRSAHAGTTPPASRDDAQAKAVRMAHALLDHAAQYGDDRLRLTIGRWECSPGSINTIADRVVFTVDARHPESAALDAVRQLIHAALPAGGQVEVLQDKPTVRFDAALASLAREACAALQLSHREMLSGAFHDAMPLAGFCPTAMLFAPSRAGVSHHPDEDTRIDDLAACTRALAWCLARLAGPLASSIPNEPSKD